MKFHQKKIGCHFMSCFTTKNVECETESDMIMLVKVFSRYFPRTI